MKNTLLQYKHSGTFANRKYEERVGLTSQNQKMRDPILVTHEKEADHCDTTIFSPTTAI